MSTDERVVEGLIDTVNRMQARLDDIESTGNARAARRPTGTIEPTIAAVAPPGTLLLNGDTKLRAEFPVLWQWAQDHGAVVTGLFGAGNGTTTFVLPDTRNRVLVGAGGTYALGAIGGADTRAIAIANLPAHDHNVGVDVVSAAAHTHTITTDTSGNHGGHQSSTGLSEGGPFPVVIPNVVATGNHTHGGTANSSGGHDHATNVTEDSVGSGTALDVRQPYLALNTLIYT